MKLVALDLFAGAGGWRAGEKKLNGASNKHEIETIYAANHWKRAVDVQKLNFPETPCVQQDLRQADFTAIPGFSINAEVGSVVIASPACQGHSRASQPRRRRYHDAQRSTAFSVLDALDAAADARAAVIENVPSFLDWRLYPVWRSGLQALGFEVSERVLDAAHFGVPQRRKRLIVLATRPGVSVPEFVEREEIPFGPCLQDASELDSSVWKPVGTATEGVKKRITAGRERHGDRFMSQWTTGHKGVSLDEPLRCITTAQSHWNLVDGDFYRTLTRLELGRAMGFPDSFRWPNGLSERDATKLLGNAVPPPLGQTVLQAVAAAVT